MRLYRLFLLCSLITFVSTASAQDSLHRRLFDVRGGSLARQLALGAGGFGMLGNNADDDLITLRLNPYSVDPQYMLVNPAWAGRYTNYAWINAGTETSQRSSGGSQEIGATVQMSKDFTLGLVLAREDFGGFSPLNPHLLESQAQISSPLQNVVPENTWGLLGAYDLGGAKLGLSLSYLSNVTTTELDSVRDVTAGLTQFGFTLGTLIELGKDDVLDLALSGIFPSLSHELETTADISFTMIGFNGRMLVRTSDRVWIVPVLNLYHASGTTSVIARPHDFPSSTSLDVGIGANYVMEDLLITGGVSVGYNAQVVPKVEGVTGGFTNSDFIFPRWNLGIEYDAASWVTLRAGYAGSTASATRALPGFTLGTPRMETTPRFNLYNLNVGQPTAGLTFGAGFHTGRLTFDATVFDDILRRGFANLANPANTFAMVSLSYRFE